METKSRITTEHGDTKAPLTFRARPDKHVAHIHLLLELLLRVVTADVPELGVHNVAGDEQTPLLGLVRGWKQGNDQKYQGKT